MTTIKKGQVLKSVTTKEDILLLYEKMLVEYVQNVTKMTGKELTKQEATNLLANVGKRILLQDISK